MAAARQLALTDYIADPSPDNLSALRTARHVNRRRVRQLKQEWWSSRLEVIERSARSKNSAALYGEARHLGR